MADAPCCQKPVWSWRQRFVERLGFGIIRWMLHDSRLAAAVLSSIGPSRETRVADFLLVSNIE